MFKQLNNQLYKDDAPFFWTADTAWSMFTNATEAEWRHYLQKRHEQGFNVVQLNLLRQWDASQSDLDCEPFEKTDLGEGKYLYDYEQPNSAYFDRVERMLAMMAEYELTPALVLVWSNYAPDNWTTPLRRNNELPLAIAKQLIAEWVTRFKRYEPIYFLSGDTDFESTTVQNYYAELADVVKATDETALTAFHIRGRLGELPEIILKRSDFFAYQSGHNIDYQPLAYEIPLAVRQVTDLPIINTEPAYEMMGYSHAKYGRFTREHVRKVSWQSVLSGASAGITYGAHGVWSWHATGQRFGMQGEMFDEPYSHDDALVFAGATDIGFLRSLAERYALSEATPLLVDMKSPEIRVAQNKQYVFVYVPVNTKISLADLQLSSEQITNVVGYDLAQRTTMGLTIKNNVIQMHTGLGDALYVLGV